MESINQQFNIGSSTSDNNVNDYDSENEYDSESGPRSSHSSKHDLSKTATTSLWKRKTTTSSSSTMNLKRKCGGEQNEKSNGNGNDTNNNNNRDRKKSSQRNTTNSNQTNTANGNSGGGNSGNNGNNKKLKLNEAATIMTDNEPTYCLCSQISYGSMILCDNKGCEIKWFHFNCVNLTTKPKGKWYCPPCRNGSENSR